MSKAGSANQKWKHNPVPHLWLGDCYRTSAQFDHALDSYRKALELEGKYYIVGDDFREDAKRCINGVELIQKATLTDYGGHFCYLHFLPPTVIIQL